MPSIRFEDDKVYAQCTNPKGFITLPVGEVWGKTPNWESCLLLKDIVYGKDLNEFLLDKYDDLIEIEFRSPDYNEVLWRAY